MKIETMLPESSQVKKTASTEQVRSSSFSTPGHSGSDAVSISDAAASLAGAVHAPQHGSASAARVEAVKEAVQGGTYPIDIRALAERIMREHSLQGQM